MHAQAAQTPEDPRIGMVLQDRYRIVRKLGDGGMGSVYEGEHVLIKRRVAIKVLHSQFAQNPEIVARFHREAEAATSIGHPNIVEVTDMGRFPDGTAYMVLEFLSGRDWAKDIETQGPQPLGKVVHIMSQVCDALSAAHAKGIVHRDLKPENIYLIERAGDPNFAKVLDFGISKIADASSENRSLTQTGTALGTPYYMAPEQCQGKKDVDLRADIYSLGGILFQALTRQYPFDDESYPMLVLKICTEPPPPLAHYRPDLPPQLQDIVNRMLAKDRTARFGSCEEVKAALAPFRGINDAPVVATNAPSTASRGPSVLEQRASGPVMTPTGTAYLPSSPGEPAITPQPAPKGSSMALAIVGVLFVLVLTGGTIGALAAFRVFDDPAPPVAHADTRPPDPPPPAADPPGDPAPGAQPTETPQVATTQVPTTPAAPPFHLNIAVQGPSQASVLIDGVPMGGIPFDADLTGDPPPQPGATPTVHTIEIRAEGYETHTEQIAYVGASRNLSVTMQRAGGSRSARSGGTRPVHQEVVIERPQPPPPAPLPPPSGTPTRQSDLANPFEPGRGSRAPL